MDTLSRTSHSMNGQVLKRFGVEGNPDAPEELLNLIVVGLVAGLAMSHSRSSVGGINVLKSG